MPPKAASVSEFMNMYNTNVEGAHEEAALFSASELLPGMRTGLSTSRAASSPHPGAPLASHRGWQHRRGLRGCLTCGGSRWGVDGR